MTLQNATTQSFTLTAEQNTIVQHQTGHAKIIAVAGSGKTATLTHFISHRLDEGVPPKRILVLMYNAAAQTAFREKQHAISGGGPLPEIRTFHSLGLKIYQHLVHNGFLAPINTRPLNKTEIELQIKKLLESLAPSTLKQEIQEDNQNWIDLTTTLLTLSKAQLDGVEAAFEKLKRPKSQHFLIKVIEAFELWRKQNQRISFDDMLYDPVQLFQQQPDAIKLFSDKMDWILVDEYQDINAIQHRLLCLLAGIRAKVAAIGDPDQTIYEFRGSAPHFILQQFQQDFSEPTEHHLSYTFRFGHALALLANNLISKNTRQRHQLTVSHQNTKNTGIKFSRTDDYGEKIAGSIALLHKRGADLNGIAVLCRLWSFARPVELQLLARGIPYRMEGAPSIFHAREIQPLLTVLMLSCTQWQELNISEQQQRLFQLLATPSPKVGHVILKETAQQWREAVETQAADKALLKIARAVKNPYHRNKLQEIAQALQKAFRCKNAAARLKIYLTQRDVLEDTASLALNRSDGMDQVGAIQALVAYLAKSPTQSPKEALEALKSLRERKQDPNERAVTLTTVHRSKGLEWPAVFIPSVTEGHFPYLEQKVDKAELESERRLLYVAITRAQRHLFMTAPLADEGKVTSTQDSRFLEEMRLQECITTAAQLDAQDKPYKTTTGLSAVTQQYLEQQYLASKIENTKV